MPTTLRKIKESDRHFFLKWWKDYDLIALTSGNFDDPDERLPEYFNSMLKNEIDHHYIIRFNSKIIGHVALMHKTSRLFEITIVIGEKEYWGKGLGTQAIKKALELGFKKLGYSKACLEVRSNNVRAIKAYESCGFVKKRIKKYPKNKNLPSTLEMILDNLPE